jgi:hypothetical protein
MLETHKRKSSRDTFRILAGEAKHQGCGISVSHIGKDDAFRPVVRPGRVSAWDWVWFHRAWRRRSRLWRHPCLPLCPSNAASSSTTFSGGDATAATALLRHSSNGRAAQSLISAQSRRGNAARRAALPPLRMGLLDAFTNLGKTPVGVDPSVTPRSCVSLHPSSSFDLVGSPIAALPPLWHPPQPPDPPSKSPLDPLGFQGESGNGQRVLETCVREDQRAGGHY